MSRIFEALQQSESERTGTPVEQFSLPLTELLRSAEKSTPGIEEKDVVRNNAVVPPTRMASKVFLEEHEVRASLPADNRLVLFSDTWGLASEKFRLLALRLRQLNQKSCLKSVLVTSAVVGEGKSFVCANLALTMSRKKDQRVLLVDGDLRRPVLAEMFGLGRLPGLTDCLKDDVPVSDRIYKIQDFGLWFLPAGDQSDNALEIMQSGRLSNIVEQLGQSFDWIIIDSPPLTPLADAVFWSRLVQGSILVTRPGTTEQRALQRALETIDKGSIVGVVLNGTTVAQRNYDQYYGYVMPEADNSNRNPVPSL